MLNPSPRLESPGRTSGTPYLTRFTCEVHNSPRVPLLACLAVPLQRALQLLLTILVFITPLPAAADEPTAQPAAAIDGLGDDWHVLSADDFQNANCDPDTWSWQENLLHCTGRPVGVLRSKKQYTNFELVAQWRHLKPGGNSGIFVWTTPDSLQALKGPGLPHGIEVQVLDIDFTRQYEQSSGKPGNWFTTHGDVFPVGRSKLKPFPPLSPDGSRSFPKQQRSRPSPEWNHYYVRAINGEVRLWVNGREVSGGSGADPATGYLCLESEGSPVEFQGLRLRELP